MPINLTQRAEAGAQITATQYDADLTTIENAVAGLEAALATLQADITALNLTTITGTLTVAEGGTGATTAAAALDAFNTPSRGVAGSEIVALWQGSETTYNGIANKSATTLYIAKP